VLIAAALLCFPWLDRPFSSRGEPREALVAQAMVATNNWISPPAYDGAVPSKPPFSHWLMAGSAVLFGELNESACRLPSALAFVLFMGAFFRFAARRTSQQTALLASGILLSSPEWLRAASSCRVDTILSTSMAGAVMALWGWEDRGRRGYPLLAVMLLAVAALTKGPVGIVLPCAVYGLFRLTRDVLTVRSCVALSVQCAGIIVPVLMVVSLWYIAGYLERGEDFLQKVWYENFQRFASTMEDEPHKHSVFYLWGVLLVGFLPWSLLWVCAAVRRWRDLTGSRAALALLERWRKASLVQQWTTLAALVIVGFFCIPSSKRGVYLLPAYPFIALYAATLAPSWEVPMRGLLKWLKGATVVGASGVVFLFVMIMAAPQLLEAAGGGALAGVSENFSAGELRDSIVAAARWWKVAWIGLSVALVWCMLRHSAELKGAGSAVGVAGGVMVVVLLANLLVVDGVLYQLSPKRWVQSDEFRARVLPHAPAELYSFGTEQYAASFYLKRPFKVAPAGVVSSAERPEAVVIAERRALPVLQERSAAQLRELGSFDTGLQRRSRGLVAVLVESKLGGDS
jgi:4-amino-4-deoxy-L-arabinose transferase-like glycosyltransferase